LQALRRVSMLADERVAEQCCCSEESMETTADHGETTAEEWKRNGEAGGLVQIL